MEKVLNFDKITFQPVIRTSLNIKIIRKYLSLSEIKLLKNKTCLEIFCNDGKHHEITLFRKPPLIILHFPFHSRENDIIIDETFIGEYLLTKRGRCSSTDSKESSSSKSKYNYF